MNKKEEKENLRVNREQEAKRKSFWDFLQGRPSGCGNGSEYEQDTGRASTSGRITLGKPFTAIVRDFR